MKNSTEYLEYNEEKEIKSLLLYRKVLKVSDDTLMLDDGTELVIIPNEGCGGCSSGWYGIEELNGCDNAITSVEMDSQEIKEKGKDDDYSYLIFVYAENKKIKLLQVDGSDGNGYYGTGYTIRVRRK